MENFTRNEDHTLVIPLCQNERVRTIINHSIWWICFIIYELSIYYYSTGTIGSILRNALYYTINISVFYSHQYLLNGTLKGGKKKYVQLILLVLTELVLFLLIKLASDFYTSDFGKPSVSMSDAIKRMAALDLYRTFFFMGLSTLYWAASNLSNLERKAKEAEIKQLTITRDALALEARLAKSENALLQQQINPHLIFNSLNFIHSTVYKVSEEAAETVVMLADILRFSMQEAGEDGKILLKDEIDQISTLISINRRRFHATAAIDLTVLGEPSDHRIIPLVLITLAENIFKHGNIVDHSATIRLELADNGRLSFYTQNKLKAKAPYPRIKSTGLQNIRIRLDYAYGNTYELKTREQDDIFESELILQL
jgi:two-component system LytT family sensor kinase